MVESCQLLEIARFTRFACALRHLQVHVLVMGKTSHDPVFKCEGTSIPLVEEMELLRVTVDNKLKFRN